MLQERGKGICEALEAWPSSVPWGYRSQKLKHLGVMAHKTGLQFFYKDGVSRYLGWP